MPVQGVEGEGLQLGGEGQEQSSWEAGTFREGPVAMVLHLVGPLVAMVLYLAKLLVAMVLYLVRLLVAMVLHLVRLLVAMVE